VFVVKYVVKNKNFLRSESEMKNKIFKSNRLFLDDTQIDFYINSYYKNVVPLTEMQFKKFLNFTASAFEKKEISKTFPRFGLAEWLI
jgi:hypothetical protein